MDINRLTEKAQEALRAAQSEATRQASKLSCGEGAEGFINEWRAASLHICPAIV